MTAFTGVLMSLGLMVCGFAIVNYFSRASNRHGLIRAGGICLFLVGAVVFMTTVVFPLLEVLGL